jgi:hypothetical protein
VSGRWAASRVVRSALGLGAIRHTCGAEQPGGGEVGRDARGPDDRAAVRSGGQSGGGEVERMACR